ELEGPVNLTAPHPATNREITTQIARAHRRRAVLPAPAPALRLALGGFSTEILRSQRAVPQALLDSGFTFTYPEISSAAHALTSCTNPSSSTSLKWIRVHRAGKGATDVPSLAPPSQVNPACVSIAVTTGPSPPSETSRTSTVVANPTGRE